MALFNPCMKIKKNLGQMYSFDVVNNSPLHGLWKPNEGINQRYLKNWADVADKI